ncbi:hypothetical protein BIV24_15560 [Streptomyces colonosanans]|uniref:Uncharacterized protein n=1 Tax=Streptomyces colonosanans TaxID=1428652 RepID=A0A1S2PCV0_9ACTN|nr:hypothetical protein BIV24_15560 [Streptomyces colonosanans]
MERMWYWMVAASSTTSPGPMRTWMGPSGWCWTSHWPVGARTAACRSRWLTRTFAQALASAVVGLD